MPDGIVYIVVSVRVVIITYNTDCCVRVPKRLLAYRTVAIHKTRRIEQLVNKT